MALSREEIDKIAEASANEISKRLHATSTGGQRKYIPSELAEIAKVFYEAQMRQKATIYAWTALYTKWVQLTPEEKSEAVHGLEERIEREGLMGYLERKRPQVGDPLTEEIISELKHKGYL